MKQANILHIIYCGDQNILTILINFFLIFNFFEKLFSLIFVDNKFYLRNTFCIIINIYDFLFSSKYWIFFSQFISNFFYRIKVIRKRKILAFLKAVVVSICCAENCCGKSQNETDNKTTVLRKLGSVNKCNIF